MSDPERAILTARVGVARLVTHRVSSAVDMPFDVLDTLIVGAVGEPFRLAYRHVEVV